MTFSLVGYCQRTGMLGTVISSSSICVSARCSFTKAQTGAIATQNITNPALGEKGLALLSSGLSATETLASLIESEGELMPWRQIGIVDQQGNAAVYSGDKALGIYHHRQGLHCSGQGNLLVSPNVIDKMVHTFEQHADLHLAERLIFSLQAALDAGGEAGPVHSAGVKVVDQVDWPIVDLRVDWDDAPLARLGELWALYKPQLNDYVLRAKSPNQAPSYGVPGDE